MEPTQKQQITETLRQADNVIVTVGRNPDIDQVAAAIALAEILTKLGKRADAIVSSHLPSQLNFLATKLLQPKFNGIRDFVISLNTSHTEADKLKYVPQGKKLNIYITPYNGNFNNEDVGFSYGDYHVDAVVALGVTRADELDKEIAAQRELLQKAKLITIHVDHPPAGGAAAPVGALDWHEPNASSVCELLMSMTEALQSGLVTSDVATALLTGIMHKTQHFTNTATTPKVMTMAAQLMAAGAKQADILAHLQAPASAKSAGPPPPQPKDTGALKPSQETSLRKKPKAKRPPEKPPRPKQTERSQPKPPAPRPPREPAPIPPAPFVPKAEVPAPSPDPTPRPSAIRDVKAESQSSVARPVVPPPPTSASIPPLSRYTPVVQSAPPAVPPTPPPPAFPQAPSPPASPVTPTGAGQAPTPPTAVPEPPGSSPPPPPHVDVDTARHAVEEALRKAAAPPPPPQPPTA